MFCKNCGQQIDDDSKFCTYCGTRLIEFERTSKSKEVTIASISRKSIETLYDPSFKPDYRYRDFGVAMLVFIIMLYFVSDGFEFTSNLSIKLFGVVSFVVRIISVFLISQYAQKLNRNHYLWAIIGFFFPSVTLIILGYKRKYLEPTNKL